MDGGQLNPADEPHWQAVEAKRKGMWQLPFLEEHSQNLIGHTHHQRLILTHLPRLVVHDLNVEPECQSPVLVLRDCNPCPRWDSLE